MQTLDKDGKYCLFVAEPKKNGEKKSHFSEDVCSGSTKYDRNESWGEQMTDTFSPDLYLIDFDLLDVETGNARHITYANLRQDNQFCNF